MKKFYLSIVIIAASIVVNAQCSIGFQSIPSPSGNVDFVATATVADSLAYPINYTWSFGDGSSGTGANPSHFYNSFGPFIVCVTMQTANGCTSTFCDSVIFNVMNSCQAGFYFYLDSITVPPIAPYIFTDLSIPGNNDSITSWNWTFQDGNPTTSAFQNSSCVFTTPGFHTICLTISTLNGCSSSYCDSININYFSAGQSFSICGLEAVLNATVNVGDYNTHWIVPSGITANNINSPTTSVTAAVQGTYNLIWEVTNNQGNILADSLTIEFISIPSPNAGGNYWPELFGANSHIKTDTVCGLRYQMSAVPSIGSGHWYSLDSSNVHFYTIDGPQQTTVYNDSLYLSCVGCYSVFNNFPKYREFVWQENSNGCISSDTIRLYFAPIPSGIFYIEQPTCSQNNFIMIAHTWPLPNSIDWMITDYEWTYPNGIIDSSIINPSNSDTIIVNWPTGNQNNVTLTTTNTWGCSSLLYTNLLNATLFASLSTNSPTTIGGNDGYIESNVSGGTPPYSYSWSNGQTTANIYNLTSGAYILNILDANNCNLSYSAQLYEPYDTTGGPIVDTLTTGIIDSCLNFVPDSFYISNVVIDSINNIATVTWTFTGGGNTSSITVQYIYYNSGNNVVVLTLSCGTKTLVTYMSFINITASVGVADNYSDKFEIFAYPVPFNDKLNIVFNSKKSGSASINVIDVTGRNLMLKQISVSSGINKIELNTSEFHSGIYILNIESDGKVFHKQLVK